MESTEAMERCDNCSQLFPESKINSHFSYCRRNIKKCTQCSMMVDINYQEDHNQQYHTLSPCKFCKKQHKGDELTKHQTTCKSRPKYCQYCQLNIALNEFDKHVMTCGSRTNTCSKCQKHIMLKQFAVHQATCRGKVIDPSPPPISNEAFKKRQVRPEIPHRQERPEIKTGQIVEPPTNLNKIPGYIHKAPSREQPQRRVIEATQMNQRFNNVSNQRFTSGERQKQRQRQKPTTNTIQALRNQPLRNYKRQEPKATIPQQVPRRRQEPKVQNPPKRQQTNTEKLYRQQKQLMRKVQKQRLQKRQQQQYRPSREYQPRDIKPQRQFEPSYQPPKTFDASSEDVELQRILMQSAEMYKNPMGLVNDLGVQDMSQSFYRDIQQQQQIEANIRKAPRRY